MMNANKGSNMNGNLLATELKTVGMILAIAIIVGFIAHGYITREVYELYIAADGYPVYLLNKNTGKVQQSTGHLGADIWREVGANAHY